MVADNINVAVLESFGVTEWGSLNDQDVFVLKRDFIKVEEEVESLAGSFQCWIHNLAIKRSAGYFKRI